MITISLSTLIVASLFLLIITLSFILSPVIAYIRDEKEFRKYPTQNWLSGFSNVARGWEIGRESDVIHSKRLFELTNKHQVVRIGPNWLSFGSARAVQDIYGYKSPCRKASVYDTLAEGGKHLNNISHKPVHSMRRRTVATFYAPKNIEDWEPRVAKSMQDLLTQLDTITKNDQPVFDANKWIFLAVFEAIIKIGLSKDMFFVQSGNDLIEIEDGAGTKLNVSGTQTIHAVSRAAASTIWDAKLFGYLASLTKRFSKKYAENWAAGGHWHASMTKLVKERIERHDNGESFNDLFEGMVAERKAGVPEVCLKDQIAEVEQMSECPVVSVQQKAYKTLVGAGSDGPAIAAIMTLYYLLKSPDTFQKLRLELDSALDSSDRVAPWHKIKSLPYLRACIDEALRLAPPVATDLMRVTPPEGHTVDGIRIPGNTNVSISAYSAHRDASVFPDPETFWPERWLEKGTDHMKDMLAAYIPFSAGTRGCIGRNVSSLLMFVSVATLVHNYDCTLLSPEWSIQFEEWFNLWPLELPLKISPRRGSADKISTEALKV